MSRNTYMTSVSTAMPKGAPMPRTIPADVLAARLLVFGSEAEFQKAAPKIEHEIRRAEKRLSDPSTPLRERVALRAY